MSAVSEETTGHVNIYCVAASDLGLEPVRKAETTTQLAREEEQTASEWIEPRYDQRGLKALVENSSILPQCIQSYGANIAGFGLGVRYKQNVDDPTEEMKLEREKMLEVLELLTVDRDTKEEYEQLIRNCETFGIGYLECIRDVEGNVVEAYCIEDIPSIRKTKRQDERVEMPYYHHGKMTVRPTRFRKYKQSIGAKTVYFKEFGDPRIMDCQTGLYINPDEDDVPELERQANEILEIKIGDGHYGEVRWTGQIEGIDGCAAAERLNNNYFENGRHTPLMFMISGGTLSKKSRDELSKYVDGVRGEAGQHKYLLIEVEPGKPAVAGGEVESPKIDVKDLAAVLQKDELFQDYIDNTRKRVQSAFQLPDIYLAYTTDYNRATAQAAMEVTEEQVFQPRRVNLEWVINNKLLNSYGFQHVEAYFYSPDLTNPDDVYKLLTVAARYGGLTPNRAKQVAADTLGDEHAKDYEGEWGQTPLALLQALSGRSTASQDRTDNVALASKAANHTNPNELIPIVKQMMAQVQKISAKVDAGAAEGG